MTDNRGQTTDDRGLMFWIADIRLLWFTPRNTQRVTRNIKFKPLDS